MTTLEFADRLRDLVLRARVGAVLLCVALLIVLLFAPAAGAAGLAHDRPSAVGARSHAAATVALFVPKPTE